MRFTMPMQADVEAVHLLIDIGPRYWEDAVVDNIEEVEAAPRIPLREGDRWILRIEVDTGRILDWPAGVTARTHYKVCDDGLYRLLDGNGTVLAEREGYVPLFLSPLENGYGDYVILDIGPDGRISGWNPDIEWFRA